MTIATVSATEWKPRKLEEVCVQITDGKHGDCRDQPGSGFYFLSCKDVSNGKLNYRNARQITEADFQDTHRRTRLAPFDILVTNSGTIGRMALVPDDELTCRTTFQKSVAILKPIPSRIESVFLYYALQANARRLIEFAGGTAQKNLLLRDLRAFEVCIPPISLQRRIASILGAYDDLIEVNRRRIAVLEEMARRLFDEWFVHFRFPGHEDRAMADRLPEAWTMRRLGDFLTLQRGHDLPSNVRVEGSVPVVSSSGISGLHNEKRADGPGIVTGRYGTLGDVYFIDGPYWPLNTALYVKDFKGNPPIFLFHMLEKTIASVKSNTSAVPGINRNVLHALAVPGSPIALRNRFEIFAAMNYRQISVIRRAVSNLQQARDLLLPRLISGDLSVATAERELEAAE